MMKYMITLFFAGIIFLSCGSNTSDNEDQNVENQLTISGQVGFPQRGKHIVFEKLTEDGSVPLDTFELKEDYTYSENVIIENAGFYRLNFYNTQQVNLILHKDDLMVNVDGNDPQGFVEIEGSRDHDFIQYVQNVMQEIQSSEKIQRINQEFVQARQQGDNETMQTLQNEFIVYDDSVKQVIINKMRELGPSLGAIEILRSNRVLNKDKHFEFFAEYADTVREELSGSPEAMSFVEEVDNMKNLSVGAVAPEIALPNPEGEIVPLSSLRGNYVLVDFWAKWCKPCRMENPNIVRAYQKYHDQGFEVYGVSLDRTKADWVQAIEEDNLDWTQVSDLKFWNSEAAQTYNINAIPFSILLDPEGKIIAKNLRGVELDNKLKEIFGE
jgi:peroxiredoxin